MDMIIQSGNTEPVATRPTKCSRSRSQPKPEKGNPIGITPFGGDRLEWIPFWQAYEPTYHKRTDFTDGQKLTALKSLLKGVALEDFKSVDNTDANYPLVIASLQKRYGDGEKLKDEHWAKLENLPPVKNALDLSALKQLRRHVESHVQSLESLGEPTTAFGKQLGRQITRCLPDELKVKWSEDEKNSTSRLTDVMQFIENQIDTRERFQGLDCKQQQQQQQQQQPQKQQGKGQQAPPPQQQPQAPAAQALAAGANGQQQQ